METTDLLGLGDTQPPPPPVGIKRDRDSLDDFEHVEQEHQGREVHLLEPTVVPSQPQAIASTLQNFLDTERGTTVVSEQVSDKFSKSDEEQSAGLPHRAAPPVPPHAPGVLEAMLAPLPDSPASAYSPKLSQREPSPPPSIPKRVPSPPVPVFQRESSPPRAAPAYSQRPVEPPPVPPVKPAAQPPTSKPTAPPSAPKPTAQPSASKPTAHIIEAEVIFCQMGLDAWFNPERLHPKVESLIYWRDPVKSGAALGAGLALLVALACCSVVSVLAYASLLALAGTVAFRIYKNILQAVQKTSEGHPFKWLLDVDISLPADRTQQIAAAATAHANAAANELRRLFLVEDLIDSLKFGVVLWSLTYVGAWFNGITLIILSYVALFSLPKAYEANKAQVDANLELARAKINEITAKVRAAVPLGKKESDKDK